ncbi:MAG: hypothetical protein Q4C18_01265 [Eubacteriales bacterium]|nr:hypothetical protein [Eubacteriales bacterium]
MKRKSGTGISGWTILMMVLLTLAFGSVSACAGTYSYQQVANSLDKVAENLEKDHFTYSQCGGKSTYGRSKGSRRVTNCALYVSWSLQDAGVLKKGQVFWIEKGGKIHGKPAVITKNKKVKVLHPGKKAKKAGLQKGDICGWASHTHTAVYAGKDSKGNLLWYSAGRDGGVKRNGKWYFKASKTKAKVRAKRYNGTISTVIRIRNLKAESKTLSKTSTKKSMGKSVTKKASGQKAGTSNILQEQTAVPKVISPGKEDESLESKEIENDGEVEVTDEELENVISDEADPDEKRDFETEENEPESGEEIPKDDSVNDEILDLDKPAEEISEGISEKISDGNEENAKEIRIQKERKVEEDSKQASDVSKGTENGKGKEDNNENSEAKPLASGTPETGDEGFLVMMILFALGCTGLLVVAHARKPGSY